MSLSSSNLYAILDAFQVDALVGLNTFEITTSMTIHNDKAQMQLNAKGLYLHETSISMYAIMAIGELGLVAKSSHGVLRRVVLLDLRDDTVKGYLQSKDFKALLTDLVESKWESEFVVVDVEC